MPIAPPAPTHITGNVDAHFQESRRGEMSGYHYICINSFFLFLIFNGWILPCSAQHHAVHCNGGGSVLTLDPKSGSGSGVVQEFGGLSSYISGPANAKAAVILITDIYGYEAPKLRKIADKVAAAGFYTVTPDFFFGDPYVSEEQKPMSVWLKEHGTDEGFKNARAVIEALKSKGITKIGAAGFCWGGKVAVELAKYHHYIQAGVLLHPTFVTLEDIQEVKVALSILGAEFDHITTPEILKQFEAALKANHEIDSFVKMFPGVSHGWTLRYDDDNEFEVKSAMEAQQDMLDWFVEHLS